MDAGVDVPLGSWTRPARSPSREDWAIVGGGVLGMTLALRLARRGESVTLIESADRLGGLASAWSVGGVVWDRHYHVILQSDRSLRALLTELGLDGDLRWVKTRTGFFTDGRLWSLSNSFEFLRFPPLGLWHKLRLAATIVYASRIKKWKRLERVPVIDWLARWSGRRTVDVIWRPLLRAKLGEQYRHTSAAFIWATISRLYAARRSGMKTEHFGYVAGGYARILERFEALLRRNGVRIMLGRAVTQVGPRPGGGLGMAFADGSRSVFDRVVVTAAAPLAARVCPDLSPQERTRLKGIRYLGIVCASVLLRRPLADYYITNVTDAWVPFTAVIEMSALVDRQFFGGMALVYLPKYLASDDPLFDRPDREIEEEWVQALARMYPEFRPSDVISVRVSRVRYVVPVSTLRYSERLPPMVTSVPGLAIVNSAHIVNGTLNVNETVQLANRSARALLAWADETRPRTSDAYREAHREPVARSG